MTIPSAKHTEMMHRIAAAGTTPDLHIEARCVTFNLRIGAISKREAASLQTAIDIRRDWLDQKGR